MLTKKLQIKPGMRLLLEGAPPGYQLAPLPEGTSFSDSSPDWIQLFVRTQAELDKAWERIRDTMHQTTVIWITYPKGARKQRQEIHRDTIAADAQKQGLKGVAIVSIDETWSALRVKPV